jgi:hypothetical protein
MTDQALEAPPAPATPAMPSRGDRPARRAGAFTLVARHPWIAAAIVLLVVSLLVVLWARVRPGYDPYGWLVWGKLSVHLKLDTNGAPSWKPLPFLFTVPFSLFGHYSLWLWMVFSLAVSLAGPVFAYRIAFRLTGAEPERRYAAYVAGLVAAGSMFLMQDTVGRLTWTHYFLSAESDTMIVAICLAAVDFHLNGRHRGAFWLWFLGSLGRPEVWPFCGLAGLWLWRERPDYRKWLYAALGLLLFFWFIIPGLSSKSFFTAGNIAQKSPRKVHGNKIIGTLDRYHSMLPNTIWVTSALTVALAAWRRWWAILLLAAGALLWLIIEIAFSIKGFPSVPRYMFESGAIVCVLSGVFIGRVILELPQLLSQLLMRVRAIRIDSRLATTLSGWGAGIAVLAICGSMAGAAAHNFRLERADLRHERSRTVLIGRLSGVVNRLGPSRILACGQPNIPIEYQSIFAWYMGIKTGVLYVSPTYLRKHPHPLVNIYPIAGGGWKVFPSHITAASAARCHHLRLVYR